MEKMNIETLILFIKDYLGTQKHINKDARLQHDLRIYGTDSEDFMIEFAQKFNIDISRFEFKKYFEDEGGVWNPWLWGVLKLKDQSEKEEFTIEDLYKFALKYQK